MCDCTWYYDTYNKKKSRHENKYLLYKILLANITYFSHETFEKTFSKQKQSFHEISRKHSIFLFKADSTPF